VWDNDFFYIHAQSAFVHQKKQFYTVVPLVGAGCSCVNHPEQSVSPGQFHQFSKLHDRWAYAMAKRSYWLYGAKEGE
jgi:hypothetical protein